MQTPVPATVRRLADEEPTNLRRLAKAGRGLPVMGVLLAGLVLSFLVHRQVLLQQQRELDQALEHQGEAWGRLTQARLDRSLAMLAMAGRTVRDVPVGQADQLLEALADQEPMLASVEWVPVPLEKGREGDVGAVRRHLEEATGLHFVRLASKGQTSGMDLVPPRQRRAVMLQAVDRGAAVASAPLSEVIDGHAGVLLLHPVYQDEMAKRSVWARRAGLRGFVVGVMPTQPLLSTGVGLGDLEARLTDMGVDQDGSTIFDLSVVHASGDVSRALSWSGPVEGAGRRWQIEVAPGPEWVARHRQPWPWVVLVGGAGFTALAATWMMALSGVANKINREVVERTTALREANRSLEDSVKAARETEVELLAAKNGAEEASQAKSQFLANMSHELRTPLTAIMGYINMMARDAGEDPARREWTKRVLRNGEHLVSLINDVLDLSKIEAGQMKTIPVDVDLGDILEQVRSILRPLATEKGLLFRVDVQGLVPRTLKTDPVRFKQILINLAGNGIKFTDEGGVYIEVSVDLFGGSEVSALTVTVRDTGVGIPKERLDDIFGTFTQAHDQQVRRFGGTGLGLDISRRLARTLGGDITVTSEVGVGSLFTFTHPLGQASELELVGEAELYRAEKDEAPFHATPHWLKDMRFLVADDSEDNQAIIRFLLEEVGATVETVDSGARAIDAVFRARRPFDLVLMDVQMPVMDGLEATGRIRARGLTVPIVAVTAYAMMGDRERCLDAGCDAHVAKPIVSERLYGAINRLIGERLGGRLPPSGTPAPVRTRRHPRPSTERLISTMADNERFHPLLEAYLSKVPEVILEVGEARASDDKDVLKRKLHQLKGTGANFGFPSISEAARAAEQALLEGDQPSLDSHLDRLVALLDAAAAATA